MSTYLYTSQVKDTKRNALLMDGTRENIEVFTFRMGSVGRTEHDEKRERQVLSRARKFDPDARPLYMCGEGDGVAVYRATRPVRSGWYDCDNESVIGGGEIVGEWDGATRSVRPVGSARAEVDKLL